MEIHSNHYDMMAPISAVIHERKMYWTKWLICCLLLVFYFIPVYISSEYLNFMLKIFTLHLSYSGEPVIKLKFLPLHGVDLVAVEGLMRFKDKNGYTSGKYFTYL